MRVFITAILSFLTGFVGQAQTISTNKTAAQLAAALAGPGVVVTNATLTCPSNANGTYTGGTNNLSIANGILLTTGDAAAVSNQASYFEDLNNLAAGDGDLDVLSGNPTFDACVLEFDLTASGDAVNFRYQFGSEEYPGFTCTQYNDIFAFFISGPGYGTPTNIAIVPGTNIPVAINSVNGGSPTGAGVIGNCTGMGPGSPFPAYFIDNQNQPPPVYDGLTTVLNARATVQPCSTYHLKLAIADASDGRYNSGVFLEQGSLTILPPAISGCPGNIVVNLGASATACGRTVSWTPPTLASGSCLGVTTSQNHFPNDFFPVGTTTVTYSFTNVGGTSTCSFTVTVVDNTPPVITCPANVTVACTASTLPAATGTPTSTEPCGPVGYTYVDNVVTGNCAGNYTINRVWTARDANNNTSSCTQVITVQDIVGPTARCKNATVTLSSGTASITPGMIDDGSFDDCSGIHNMTVSPSTFSCSNIGSNTVTLTVYDNCGNFSTCTATVTVVGEIPTCAITVTPENNIYTGGIPTNIYLGYGPQRATITASSTTTGPFTYSWAGPTSSLSATNVQSPLFTPTVGGTYVFTVTITNQWGCTSSCSVTFCVKDIRVQGNGNNGKVYLCHYPATGVPNTLSISTNAVPSHLSNHTGDVLGQCGQTCGALQRIIAGNGTVPGQVTVAPNPNNGAFVVTLPDVQNNTQMVITDLQGKVIQSRLLNEKDGQVINVQLTNVPYGIYLLNVIYSGESYRVKLEIRK